MSTLDEIKPLVRSILLALGREADEAEFHREYLANEGVEFASVLEKLGMTFWEYMKSLPDVCRVYKTGDRIMVVRVSSKETEHMDKLTIKKKKPLKISHRSTHRPTLRSTRFAGLKRLVNQPSSLNRVNLQVMSRGRTSINSQTRKTASRWSDSQPKMPKMITTTFDKTQPSTVRSVKTTQMPASEKIGIPKVDSKVLTTNAPHQNKRVLPWQMKEVVFKPSPKSSVEGPKQVVITQKENRNPNDTKSIQQRQQGSLHTKNSIPTEKAVQTKNPVDEIFHGKSSASLNQTNVNAGNHQQNHAPILLPISKQHMALMSEQNNLNSALEIRKCSHLLTIPFTVPQFASTAGPRDAIRIKMVEITSPSYFIFHSYDEKLRVLVEEMSRYYNCFGMDERFIILQAFKGLTVAALSNGFWFRAEILDVRGDKAILFFVDFGTKKIADLSTLRYLEKLFAYVTRKTGVGSLSRVNPSEWTLRSIAFFVKRSVNKILFAHIKSYKKASLDLEIYFEDNEKFANLSNSMIEFMST